MAAALGLSQTPDAGKVRAKIALIEADAVAPKSRVEFPLREILAYANEEGRKEVGDGFRNLRLTLGSNAASGSAIVNFVKLKTARGEPPGLVLRWMLRGDRQLAASARFQSGGGKARVDVDEVTLDGLVLRGKLLDLLIDYYLLPRYPDAKIGKPFDLHHGIDRIDVTPAGVTVRMTGP